VVVRQADMTRIVAVRCALPPHRHRQAELTARFCELSDMEPGRRTLLERLHANAGVDTRHTVLPLAEYGELDGIGPTNDLYIERATTLGEQAIRSVLQAAELAARDLDLLIVTSVTGVAVPSIDARLMPRLGLRPDVRRLPIFGLGCVAGAAGLARLHDYLLAWPRHVAALLAVELCSLTLPAAAVTATPDMVVSGLFGDGATALVARGEQLFTASAAHTVTTTAGNGPRVVASRSEVYPGTGDVLGWRLNSDGFRIVLTAELADVVEPKPPWLTIMTTAYSGLLVAGAYVANQEVVCLPATSAVPVLEATGIWLSGNPWNCTCDVPDVVTPFSASCRKARVEELIGSRPSATGLIWWTT